LSHVEIEPFLADQISQSSLTIEAYSRANRLNPDWSIEAAARAGILPLMTEGVVDQLIMDILVLQIKAILKPPQRIHLRSNFLRGWSKHCNCRSVPGKNPRQQHSKQLGAHTNHIRFVQKSYAKSRAVDFWRGRAESGETSHFACEAMEIAPGFWEQLPAGRWSGILRCRMTWIAADWMSIKK